MKYNLKTKTDAKKNIWIFMKTALILLVIKNTKASIAHKSGE